MLPLMAMDENISKKEEYDQKKAQKERARQAHARKRAVRRAMPVVLGVLVVVAGVGWLVWRSQANPIRRDDLIATRGIHWHARLSIIIQGGERVIPANIGLGAVHSPVHTHDPDGVIHIEYSGVVTRDDVRLGRFFEVWGETFNSECIFDFCNGPDGTVRMFVNGEANSEFDAYLMRDGDRIEIRYE